jgi:hypothetical protein
MRYDGAPRRQPDPALRRGSGLCSKQRQDIEARVGSTSSQCRSRRALPVWLALAAACATAHPAVGPTDPGGAADPGWTVHQASNPTPNAAYQWLDIILEASARSVDRGGARPSILSREMAMAVTAMFDAWAAYDAQAVGTRLGSTLRRPAPERTEANKGKAIAFAVHRVLVDLYPEDEAWLDAQMRAVGFDPAAPATDRTAPEGLGLAAAEALLAYRHRDGANQMGDEPGSDGKPYSDYTHYEPRNTVERVVDPDRWQPIPFDDGHGGTLVLGFLTPYWGKVKPFALERGDQFRPGPLPKANSPGMKTEIDQVIAFNGSLALEQKAVVEFMRDGPRSTGQSGHWLRFAQDVARRDGLSLDQDVKLFFAVGNVVFDAFIACWEAKRFYDSSRPWTLIRQLYAGQQITGYLGPCKGVGRISASQWRPYSPATFITPPFPGYPSGHSTASGAAAKLLELFTGSDHCQVVVHREVGELTEKGCPVAEMESVDGKPAQGLSPEHNLDLTLSTFSQAAEMAGISRVMGGYHIQSDNSAGLELGRKVASYSWPKYQAYFDGTAPAP